MSRIWRAGKSGPCRLCVVCGARVTNINPKTMTCDSICTDAKKNNRTRAEQIRHWVESQPYEPINDNSANTAD